MAETSAGYHVPLMDGGKTRLEPIEMAVAIAFADHIDSRFGDTDESIFTDVRSPYYQTEGISSAEYDEALQTLRIKDVIKNNDPDNCYDSYYLDPCAYFYLKHKGYTNY